MTVREPGDPADATPRGDRASSRAAPLSSLGGDLMPRFLRTWRWCLLGAALLGLATSAAYRWWGYIRVAAVRAGAIAPRTVTGVLAEYGARAERRFAPACRAADIPWPPPRLRLLAFKEERSLEVWAATASGPFVRLAATPVLGASGGPGPKRRAGDRQVPEGFYRLPILNPDSRYHLSVRVGYPNEEDVAHATVPRAQMGGDIYLHGGSASIGCLAVGDPAIEELFCLVALVPEPAREIWIAPVDFRLDPTYRPVDPDPWVAELYRRLADRLRECPAAPPGDDSARK